MCTTSNAKIRKIWISLLLNLYLSVPLVLQPVNAPTAWSSSNTYYVSTSGNDSNDGSLNHPRKTIQKWLNTMVAGDTVTGLPR
jgi:hypothetical protein